MVLCSTPVCTISNSVESINQNDVENYKDNLISLSFESGSLLQSIGDYSFSNFNKLESADLSNCNSLQNIPLYCFFECRSLSSVRLPMNGALTVLRIGCFSRCGLEKIEIPKTVTYFEHGTDNIGVFSECYSLSSITFPDGNNLEVCGKYAISRTGLSSFEVGPSVKDILGATFEGSSTKFREITMSGQNSMFSVDHGILYQGTKLVFCPPGIPEPKLKNGITSIGEEAFMNSLLVDCSFLKKNIQTIEGYIFYSCPNLRRVYFPSSITSIGARCFVGCPKLITVVFPDTLDSIESEVFLDCKALQFVTIPNGVKTIKSKAFSGSTSLHFLVIPDSVDTFEKDCFTGSGVENCGIICSDAEKELMKQRLNISDNAFALCTYSTPVCTRNCRMRKIGANFLYVTLILSL